MSDSIGLSSVTVNCPDATQLAGFYAEITGGQVTFTHPSWATLVGPGGRIDFQTGADYSSPRWPGDTSLVHLDFLVDDLIATEARVLAAGALCCDLQPNAEHCLVITDPAGHPFCLTTVDEIGCPSAAQPGHPQDDPVSARVPRDHPRRATWPRSSLRTRMVESRLPCARSRVPSNTRVCWL